MLFRVTNFSREKVCFYIVPDDPFEIPQAKLQIDEMSFLLKPTEKLDSLIRSRRHSTGLCGFEFEFPTDLEFLYVKIFDASSNLLIFRHQPDEAYFFNHRLIIPKYWSDKWQLSQAFLNRFVYHYDFESDVKSQETFIEILENHCTSTCISGNIPIKDLLYRFDENIILWVVLDHPDNFWLRIISSFSMDKSILNLKSNEIHQISNPLLRSISQKREGFISSEDFREAYKVFSQATLITTAEAAHKNNIIEYNPDAFGNKLNSAINTEDSSDHLFAKNTICREDIIFYNNVIKIINSF